MSLEIRLGLLLFLTWSTAVIAGGGPAIDRAWLEKARREIPLVLEKYQSVLTRFEEESECRWAVAPGVSIGKARTFHPGTSRDRNVRLGDYKMHEKTRTDDDTPDTPRIVLECDNGDYHFALTKEKADSPYILGNVAPGKAQSDISAQSGIATTMLDYLRTFLSVTEENPKYTLKTLRYDAAKGLLGAGVRIAAGENEFDVWIYVEPANSWRVVERRVETKAVAATDTFSYGETLGGVPFPTGSKNLSVYKVEQAGPNLEITARLISIKLTDKKASDFRVSAFGFPEPFGTPTVEGGIRWHLWLSFAAAVVLAGGGLIVILRRRYCIVPPAPEAKPN